MATLLDLDLDLCFCVFRFLGLKDIGYPFIVMIMLPSIRASYQGYCKGVRSFCLVFNVLNIEWKYVCMSCA